MPFSSPWATLSMKRRWAPFHVKHTLPCSLEFNCRAEQNVRNCSTGKRTVLAPCALDHPACREIGVQAHGGRGELLIADDYVVRATFGTSGGTFFPMHTAFVQGLQHAGQALHQ